MKVQELIIKSLSILFLWIWALNVSADIGQGGPHVHLQQNATCENIPPASQFGGGNGFVCVPLGENGRDGVRHCPAPNPGQSAPVACGYNCSSEGVACNETDARRACAENPSINPNDPNFDRYAENPGLCDGNCYDATAESCVEGRIILGNENPSRDNPTPQCAEGLVPCNPGTSRLNCHNPDTQECVPHANPRKDKLLYACMKEAGQVYDKECITANSIEIDNDCKSDFQCISGKCSTKGFCICNTDGDCGEGERCARGGVNRCVALIEDNSACNRNKTCMSGKCTAGRCAATGEGEVGATCDNNQDCASNKCQGKTCVCALDQHCGDGLKCAKNRRANECVTPCTSDSQCSAPNDRCRKPVGRKFFRCTN